MGRNWQYRNRHSLSWGETGSTEINTHCHGAKLAVQKSTLTVMGRNWQYRNQTLTVMGRNWQYRNQHSLSWGETGSTEINTHCHGPACCASGTSGYFCTRSIHNLCAISIPTSLRMRQTVTISSLPSLPLSHIIILALLLANKNA